jgi:hypothetical protein
MALAPASYGLYTYTELAITGDLARYDVAGAALVGAIPGGLFELTFGIWLIARGFASTATLRSCGAALRHSTARARRAVAR